MGFVYYIFPRSYGISFFFFLVSTKVEPRQQSAKANLFSLSISPSRLLIAVSDLLIHWAPRFLHTPNLGFDNGKLTWSRACLPSVDGPRVDSALDTVDDNQISRMDSPSAQRQITSFFANAARKEKLNEGVILKGMFLADDVIGVEDAGSAKESATMPIRKRKNLEDNATDLEDFRLATESTANPPKRQRRQTAKEKAEEEKAAALNVQESFPEPRGEPEVWADVGHFP